MITIIDYGAGNIPSVIRAFQYLDCNVEVTSRPEQVAQGRRLVLPGVGHFASTAALKDRGIHQAVRQAIDCGASFLGICMGMQWLYEGSDEAPGVPGLALFAGTCAAFPPGTKSPHVGWNSLHLAGASRLMRGIAPGEFVYFTHSYRATPGLGTTAVAQHGSNFAAAVERDNIFGVQFHPEKSAVAGLRILRNFAELPC